MGSFVSKAAAAALVLGSTLRLTRLVITDQIGAWFIREPIEEWAETIKEMTGQEPFPRARQGLDCPFCVGFWIGAAVLGVERLTRNRPRLRDAAGFIGSSLTVNYLAAHLGSRLGDAGYAEGFSDE